MNGYRKAIEPLSPYIPGRPVDDVKREYGLSEVIKLASNENPYGCSEQAKKAIMGALSNTPLYPDGNCTLLRNALAEKYGLEPQQLIFGSGADEIISMIGKVFIEEGDECITGSVTFSQYMASAASMGGVMVYAGMKNHGYDLGAILNKITNKTKVIFIANPNNPTGTIHTGAEQRAFMEKVPPNVIVVFDEAYSEFTDNNDYPDTLGCLKEYKNIMLVKTFSKVYGLASLRIGYAVAHADIVSLFEKIRNPFNVSTIAQSAALAALSDDNFVKESAEKNKKVREYTCMELDKMGVSYIPSHTNFVMADVKKDSTGIFVELMKRGYIIRAGAAFGMDSYLRITLGTMEEMQGFIKALKEVL